MFRQLCAMFDEYQSRENAKHVLRAMKENARQGYWNGARPPFGYQALIVEKRADATKKQLTIDPAEAAVVRRVFDRRFSPRNGWKVRGSKAALASGYWYRPKTAGGRSARLRTGLVGAVGLEPTTR